MQTNNIDELYIDIPRGLLQEHAEKELGRLLTADELVEVSQLVVEAAFAAIHNSINTVISEQK